MLEATLILIIDYTAWGNLVFDVVPISPEVGLFILPFALAMLLLEERPKFAVVRLKR